ncbi:MAG TPA: hypothetical protein VLM85_03715, partial [Polyangiaceae bacterium]|nr:hypothetical protein [Polyangiaceae bacterium]
CAPWGPLQVLVCQPASGCHPVGDLCHENSDCCGGADPNPKELCLFPFDGGPGNCSNPTGCKPNGDICRLVTNQCNATDNCCSGYVEDAGTCRQDNLGVPRCSYPAGSGSCVPANGSCASSADCCGLAPCVPGDGGFACYAASCVPASGACTRDADCCVGTLCYLAGGATSGTCRPVAGDGGAACALYGQSCTTTSDCCYGAPCTGGRCEYPVY